MTYRYKIATVFLLGFFIDCINIFMSAIALPDIAASFQQANLKWLGLPILYFRFSSGDANQLWLQVG